MKHQERIVEVIELIESGVSLRDVSSSLKIPRSSLRKLLGSRPDLIEKVRDNWSKRRSEATSKGLRASKVVLERGISILENSRIEFEKIFPRIKELIEEGLTLNRIATILSSEGKNVSYGNLKAKMRKFHPEYASSLKRNKYNSLKTLEFTLKSARVQREVWKRPGYREKMSLIHKGLIDKNERVRLGNISRKAWENPSYREAQTQMAKQRWKEDPNIRARMEALWVDPDFRELMSRNMSERWKNYDLMYNQTWGNPAFREKLLRHYTPEKRAEMQHDERMVGGSGLLVLVINLSS